MFSLRSYHQWHWLPQSVLTLISDSGITSSSWLQESSVWCPAHCCSSAYSMLLHSDPIPSVEFPLQTSLWGALVIAQMWGEIPGCHPLSACYASSVVSRGGYDHGCWCYHTLTSSLPKWLMPGVQPPPTLEYKLHKGSVWMEPSAVTHPRRLCCQSDSWIPSYTLYLIVESQNSQSHCALGSHSYGMQRICSQPHKPAASMQRAEMFSEQATCQSSA